MNIHFTLHPHRSLGLRTGAAVGVLGFEIEIRILAMRFLIKAKSEPLDETVPLVNRSLGKSSLELLEKNDVINIWEILSDLPLPNSVFQSVFE